MMYYVNWVLTNAQLELLAADVSVVDYNYGDKKQGKKKKGAFDDRPASSENIRKANEEWIAKYGTGENAGKGLSINDILGSGIKADVGVKLRN